MPMGCINTGENSPVKHFKASSRIARVYGFEFDLAAHQLGADETLTVLLAEIQQIVAW